jgi:ATP-dependent helicase Lhr and Lhr-like helicase
MASPLEHFTPVSDGDEQRRARPVTIGDTGGREALELKVKVPVQDMARLGEPLTFDDEEFPEGRAAAVRRRSIGPAIHPRLLALLRQHRSTIIFAIADDWRSGLPGP